MKELETVIKKSQALEDVNDRALLRAQIGQLEKRVGQELQVEPAVEHFFSKGIYARQITLLEGTLIVGKIHKHKNLNIISKGRVSFFSTDGVVQVEAPYTFVASPGVKRVIVAHTDTVWTTIHATDLTDLKAIEDEFIAKNYSEVAGISKEELDLIKEAEKCLGGQ